MRILYIYRSKDAGPSIRRVFEPIEKQMRLTEEVDSVFLPCSRASFKDILTNIRFIKEYIKDKSFDVFHITGDVYYLTWFLPRKKTIVTVHDLVFFVTRKKSIKSLLFWLLWILPLRLAAQVTFISEKSLCEAKSLIHLDNDKLSVIPNPIADSFKYTPKEINTKCPEILHVGTKANKNLERVAKALCGLQCKLHVIGKLSDNQLEELAKNQINFYSESNVSDDFIIDAYNKCDIVSFPSLYEGFGMPIIEGQAIGRPVVTSNISPMQEIAGRGAILVDPTSITSIRKGFLESISRWKDLIHMGLQNSDRFKPKFVSECYKKLYEKICI